MRAEIAANAANLLRDIQPGDRPGVNLNIEKFDS